MEYNKLCSGIDSERKQKKTHSSYNRVEKVNNKRIPVTILNDNYTF